MRANRTRVIFFALNSGSYGFCTRDAANRGESQSTRQMAHRAPVYSKGASLRALRKQRRPRLTKSAQAASGGRRTQRSVTHGNAA